MLWRPMRGCFEVFLFLVIGLFINKANALALEILPTYSALSLTEHGRLKVSEQGDLLGATLMLSTQMSRSLAIAFSTSQARGVTDYEGFTQFGGSHSTRTDFTLKNWQLDASWFLNEQFALVGGFNTSYWVRDIRAADGVLGIKERYQWQEASLGVQIKWPLFNHDSMQLTVEAINIDSGQVKFDYPNYVDSPITLRGMTGGGYEMKLRYEKCIGASCWSVAGVHRKFAISESALQNVQLQHVTLALIEPATDWSIKSLAVGWRYGCAIM